MISHTRARLAAVFLGGCRLGALLAAGAASAHTAPFIAPFVPNPSPIATTGTGTTIVQIPPGGNDVTGTASVFAQIDPNTLPGPCPGGVGLTTASRSRTPAS